jgi:hypothetical protein
MKQFNFNDLNSLKPDVGDYGTITKLRYEKIFGKYRLNRKKNKLITAYKFRSDVRGRSPFILNIEELASIWHFPIEASVKAPLIQKALGRKAEPPSSLPVVRESVLRELNNVGRVKSNIFDLTVSGEEKKPAVKARHEPPGNLPVV